MERLLRFEFSRFVFILCASFPSFVFVAVHLFPFFLDVHPVPSQCLPILWHRVVLPLGTCVMIWYFQWCSMMTTFLIVLTLGVSCPCVFQGTYRRTAIRGQRCERNKAMGLWKNHRWHWRDRSVSELNYHFWSTELPYVRCYEESGLQRCFDNIVANICNISEGHWYFVLYNSVPISCLYDQFYAMPNWTYWAQDVNVEMRRCISGCFVFLVAIMRGRFGSCLNGLETSTSSAQRGDLHTSAVDYCRCRRLLSSNIILQSFWVIK